MVPVERVDNNAEGEVEEEQKSGLSEERRGIGMGMGVGRVMGGAEIFHYSHGGGSFAALNFLAGPGGRGRGMRWRRRSIEGGGLVVVVII